MNNIYPLLTTFNLPLLKPSDFTSFALPLCTIQNDREPDIYSSNVPFLCLITDHRFPDELIFHIMKPYICDVSDDDCDYTTGYGWLYCGNDNWCDNQYHPVHGDTYDDRKVIGFIKL